MITSTDLRIGNILQFDENYSTITAIDLDLDGVSNEIIADGNYKFIEISSSRVKGIRITEETLAGTGFNKANNISDTISKWSIEESKFILYFNGENAGLITSLPQTVPIYYIHQLQNLYFSLTGKELITSELMLQKSEA